MRTWTRAPGRGRAGDPETALSFVWTERPGGEIRRRREGDFDLVGHFVGYEIVEDHLVEASVRRAAASASRAARSRRP